MRICMYTETALPKMGGQELVVDALARQFLALGHEPIVLAPWPRKLRADDSVYPYRVVRHMRFFSTHYFVPWYRRCLERVYREHAFDVLHCHGIYPPAFLAALARPSMPIPVVVTSHGGDVYEKNVRLKKPVIRERCTAGLRNADALIAISRFTRDGFARVCPEAASRIVEIPNGVNLASLTTPVPRPADLDHAIKPKEYAVFLGRLKHRKGVDVLLHALARTPNSGNVQLVIVGNGEERNHLELVCDPLDLRERVRFVGTRGGAEKAWLIQNARFAVVPSRQWEAFPLVVLENYASGLPTIGTSVPGLVDLIQPEETGLVVSPEDPESLASALARMFAEDALVDRMSRSAREFVTLYDWRNVAIRHLDLYHRLLDVRQALAA